MEDKKTRSPIKWYGGKYHLLDWLLPKIPPHFTYCEVFAGGAQLLFAKPHSPVEVYNDIDSRLINFFLVLQREHLFKEFAKLLELTPYSRELFERYKTDDTMGLSEVEQAQRFFVTVRQSFGGSIIGGWSTHKQCSSRAMVWLRVIEGLPEVRDRLMGVLIEHQDWRKCIEQYDYEESFFYLDPPYVPSTRVSPDIYEHEMSESDHEDLVEMLKGVKGKVILSGYDNEIYEGLGIGWRKLERPAKYNGHSAKGRTEKVESLWLNYEPPDQQLSFA